MTKDVAEYRGTCLVCQRRNKMPKKTASLHPVGVPIIERLHNGVWT